MRISDWSSGVCSSDLPRITLAAFLGADEREHDVREMRAGGPDFLAVDAPTFRRFARRRPHGREVRTGAGFGQADEGVAFNLRNAGQIPLALPPAPIAKRQQTGLAPGTTTPDEGGARPT